MAREKLPPHELIEKKLAVYRGIGAAEMASITNKNNDIDIGFSAQSLDEKLVDLHDASRRYALGGKSDALMRERVVSAVGQILNHDLSFKEKSMVADIVLTLIRQAEIDLRESISERLCVMPEVPPEIVLNLAHDAISVAKPVLQYSPVLSEMDLLYIIQSKSAEYWQAIARRKLLDVSVVDALVDCSDEGTALCLMLNDSIELKTSALEAFAELSKYSEKLAEPLLRRKELPQKIVMDLFWHVSGHLREHILKNFDIPKDKLDAALQDALEDFTDTAAGLQDPKPSKLMQDLAEQYGRIDRITDGILIKTLRRGQVRFFVALMSERTGLPYTTVHQLMRQVGGQGMAVACRATGVLKENFVSIFLLSRSLTRGDRAVDALELRKAIKYFDAMTEDMASTILANTIVAGTKQ
ncbi:MAG: DUF2336 domain-containing protein [Alphaproteobacteria bacterium]|nr:DUF2336 domain-containing protein [Alphaproteobacteria bacterium]